MYLFKDIENVKKPDGETVGELRIFFEFFLRSWNWFLPVYMYIRNTY